MEPENLQSVLQEAGIQVDMKNLQNPTEDFMMYLITEYLNKFHFDGSEISKSTKEQLDCLSCPDSAADAIKIINLYSAISSVCSEIFLKDFCLTDITSPGPKKARKHIKILFNFLAYFKNKMIENEMIFKDLNNQQREIEDMIDQKNSIIAKIGATISDRENKLDLKRQLQQEIDEIRLNMDDNDKTSRELEKSVKNVMLQHQEIYKKCSELSSKAMKLHKMTSELQTKIVKSPEEYAARSEELSKVLEIKKKERQDLNDSITRKKQQIKNNENAQELVKDLNEQFSKTSSIFKQHKEISERLESVRKELNLLKIDIAKWTHIEMNNTSSDSSDENQKGHEHLLFELDKNHLDKERELTSQKILLEGLKADFVKKRTLVENELKTIESIQEETSELLKKYKDHFQKEISQEHLLRIALARKL